MILTEFNDSQFQLFVNHLFFRFIFVHFNAWEYVGSDTLWAGIVTNLSRAIEAEFGILTSRIFRLLNIDVIHNDNGNDEKTIQIEIYQKVDKKSLEEVLKQYGVLKRCQKQTESMWEVEFDSTQSAVKAYEDLKSKGIDVTMQNNIPSLKKQSKSQDKDKSCPLLCHFVHHFAKHPKTTLGLPNLFWWFLFYLAFFALIYVAYKVADIFNLDIYRVSENIFLLI